MTSSVMNLAVVSRSISTETTIKRHGDTVERRRRQKLLSCRAGLSSSRPRGVAPGASLCGVSVWLTDFALGRTPQRAERGLTALVVSVRRYEVPAARSRVVAGDPDKSGEVIH
jgi:hypothetical protein